MVFSSIVFICGFLPVVLVLYWVLPGIRAKNALLIVASILFYAYGEPVLTALLLLSTVANYLFGLVVGHGKHRRVWLALAVVANLAFLGVFKYADMAIGTLDALFGLSIPKPGLPLPLGISFYTFQALSYVIDVYRGEVECQRSYPRLLLFISLFPQLVAGPIVKYHDIEKQISQRTLTLDHLALGMRRFICGLGKKVLIANVMASAADALWGVGPAGLDARGAWLAALAYLMQIYFDFSGYSDMAIGLGQLFGFEFRENFDHPYASSTIKEFWRRWHISLSTWFKEYLYIPLGGNRRGKLRAVLNRMIVFLLCGLWHGASWTFVVWGAIHGALLLVEEFVPLRKMPRILGHVYTLLMVTLAFVVFRAESLSQAGAFIGCMFGGWAFTEHSTIVVASQLSPLFVATFVAACVGCTPLPALALARLESHAANKSLRAVTLTQTLSFAACLACLVLCVAALASGTYNPFIYFRF
ncbi:MAG: MBOAT family protein [Coriobacteriales bacterium]|nr:MBOAT family protein [Coriobacteriales bacterium]